VQGPEQKIRNMLLEVLNRLPNNETLRPHVQVTGLAVNPSLPHGARAAHLLCSPPLPTALTTHLSRSLLRR